MSLVSWLRIKKQQHKWTQHKKDLADRKAYLVEVSFETILKEGVCYEIWVRLDHLKNGLESVNRLVLLDHSVHVGEKTYNTKHIVNVESKTLKEGYIKKSVKKKLGGYSYSGRSYSPWVFRRHFAEGSIAGEYDSN